MGHPLHLQVPEVQQLEQLGSTAVHSIKMNASSACRLANRRFLFQSLSSMRRTTSSIPFRLNRHTFAQAQSRSYASRYASSGNASELRGTAHNPMDNISVDPAWAAERAKHIRDMKYLAFGLACTIGATIVTVLVYPAPPPAKNDRQPGSGGSSLLPRTNMDSSASN